MAFDPPAPVPQGEVQVAEAGDGKFTQHVRLGQHLQIADEPVAAGGRDAGPGPYDYLLAALGSCTSMTLRMYADLKKFPLERVEVHLRHRKIHAQDCAECATQEGKVDEIERRINLIGPLSAEQREKLLQIADKCPVHRTLTSDIRIVTTTTTA